jgi:glutamate dehydrogenase (NAD(P)+)
VDGGGIVDRGRVPARVVRLRAADWCQVPAELLVPAAVEDAITVETLPRVTRSARLLVEGANSPVTEEAERRLEEAGVTVVPDFVANAGSAAALGLVIQGLAGSEQVLVREACLRIARATAAVVAAAGAGTTARQRAVRLSERLAATAAGG